MYTTSQVAALLGVHPKTVKRWVLTGKLMATRTPGGHYRFSEASVNALQKES